MSPATVMVLECDADYKVCRYVIREGCKITRNLICVPERAIATNPHGCTKMKKRNHSTVLFVFVLAVLGLSLLAGTPNIAMQTNSTGSAVDTSVVSSIPRDVRVAVYAEQNLTAPTYAVPYGGDIGNNASEMSSILEDGGYDVTLLTTADIAEHKLLTSDYDIFVMTDILPRENITHLVWDFYAGGGGLLALDGAGLFLCYMGILPPEASGSTGYPTYWAYQGQDIVIETRHPVSQSYAINDTIDTSDGYLYFRWDWSALAGTSIGPHLVRIANSTDSPDGVSALAYDSVNGGNVVHLMVDLRQNDYDGIQQMIVDAADWLCPRPKARIAFDYTHMPRLGVDVHDENTQFPGYYSELRNYWTSRDFTFDKLYPSVEGNLTADRLEAYDMLVFVSPDYNFTVAERAAVMDWVSNGGSIFVLSESWSLLSLRIPIDQLNFLMEPLDMEVNETVSAGSPLGVPVAADIPIVERCSLGIQPATSGAINITGPGAHGVWIGDGDIMAATQIYGLGRVVLVADMNWADNAHITGVHNAQFAINVANWLTADDAQILLYVDDPYSENYFRTPVVAALNDLGYSFYLTASDYYLNVSLVDSQYTVLIVDTPWFGVYDYYEDIDRFVQAGGRLLMSDYMADSYQSSPLWATLGFEFSGEGLGQSPLYIWNSAASIFNVPNNYGAANFTPYTDYGDEGDRLTVTNGMALAGWSSTPTIGNASIVLGSSGRTLYNGYLIDQFVGDLDDSTYPDNFELWENEIAFIMRPVLNHPSDIEMQEGDSVLLNWTINALEEYDYDFSINGSIDSSGQSEASLFSADLSNLEPGLYELSFSVRNEFYVGTTDTVMVNVTAIPAVGLPIPLLVAVGAGIAVVAVIVVVFLNRRKPTE